MKQISLPHRNGKTLFAGVNDLSVYPGFLPCTSLLVCFTSCTMYSVYVLCNVPVILTVGCNQMQLFVHFAVNFSNILS